VREFRAAILDRQSSQVAAIQFEKIEGDEHSDRLPVLATQGKEVGVTRRPEDIRLAVDRAGLTRNLRRPVPIRVIVPGYSAPLRDQANE